MNSAIDTRAAVAAARRIVIKLGTAVLSLPDGRPALARLGAIIDAVADLRARDRQVLLVSSGAVGLGRAALGLRAVPSELADRQACAAVGQMRLMGLYEERLSQAGLACAQVLLTQGDFEDRLRYLNLRGTLASLLRMGVVPVINENDAVATDELAYDEGLAQRAFGDNDRLSALVAAKLDADLLILLTDVSGVLERDPRDDPSAAVVATVADADLLLAQLGGPGPGGGRGGMRSKVEAAAIAARAGCHAIVASGLDPDVLPAALAGREVGTWFPPRQRPDARRRWIAFATAPRGALVLDTGAVAAIRERGASVLAAGVTRCEGDFHKGDVVELRDPQGKVIGRGIVHCDAAAAQEWCNGRSPEGVRNHDALVHRDHLALE